MAEEDIYRDYLFSNFSAYAGHNRVISSIKCVWADVPTVKAMEGDTLSEKIRNYLLSIHVTEEELDSIVSILRDDNTGGWTTVSEESTNNS